MSLPTRIYLTGFMGSGKSTLGPPLARVLNYRFIDLDSAIEARIGCTIATYFAREGEGAFRKVERACFEEIACEKRVVVALGGGALMQKSLRALAYETGQVVYLRWPVERLVERLGNSGTRPLLHDARGDPLPESALKERIEKMLADREPVYMQADVIVELNRHRVSRAVDELITRIRRASYCLQGRKDIR